MIDIFGLHNLKKIKNKLVYITIILALLLTLTGCEKTGRTVVLTTGFNENEVFKLAKEDEVTVCTYPEMMVFLNDLTCQYTNAYGDDILKITADGRTMAESIKDAVMADLSQIKAMKILAQREGISLSEGEIALAKDAAHEYYESLSDRAREYMHSDENVYAGMYSDYALINKYYDLMIEDINPEISDDEARTITVQHIFIKTYEVLEDGTKALLSAEERQRAYELAVKIRDMAKDGEHDFKELAKEYSDSSSVEYSFGLGEAPEAFETAAFNLGKNEISDVVATDNGYHIIKCISTFNMEETDRNKERISQEKKEAVFGSQYDEFARTLITSVNEELWDEVRPQANEEMNPLTFMEVYHKYFG